MSNDIFLTNNLSNKKEKFVPIDEKNIRMYVCGPTVYDDPHIGNARPIVVFDILFKIFKKKYPKVTYVRNITDVDDKIINSSKEKNISISDLTNTVIKSFDKDCNYLNCDIPTHQPKATEHIDIMIEMISDLTKKGFAYEENQHVYFEVNKFKDYGKLSNKNLDELIAGSRVEVSDNKKNSQDFVLWKPSKDDEPSWESPWGNGRPGWHLECSAMSKKLLGNEFDIHGGGIDLLFPHHENEIAQSRCANDTKVFANYWLHNAFITMSNEKMAKSQGNIYTSDYHYEEVDDEILKPLYDDLNTPGYIANLHKLYDKAQKGNSTDKALFTSACNFIGLLNETEIKWLEFKKNKLSINEAEILDKIEQRNKARKDKKYEEADKIRDELLDKGVLIEDKDDKTTWKFK